MNNIKSIKQFREESKGNKRILYHLNYWDGPISGVVLWDGIKQYFHQIDEIVEKITMSDDEWSSYCEECVRDGYEIDNEDRIEYDRYRIFAVYDTPRDYINSIEYDHKQFQKYVGNHTDYDIDGKKGEGASYEKLGFFKIPKNKIMSKIVKFLNKFFYKLDLGDLKHPSNHSKFYKGKRKSTKLDINSLVTIDKFTY